MGLELDRSGCTEMMHFWRADEGRPLSHHDVRRSTVSLQNAPEYSILDGRVRLLQSACVVHQRLLQSFSLYVGEPATGQVVHG